MTVCPVPFGAYQIICINTGSTKTVLTEVRLAHWEPTNPGNASSGTIIFLALWVFYIHWANFYFFYSIFYQIVKKLLSIYLFFYLLCSK